MNVTKAIKNNYQPITDKYLNHIETSQWIH